MSAFLCSLWQGWTIAIIGPPNLLNGSFALFGIVLALSSVWALIPAAVASIIAVIRTLLEDQTLQEELPGYQDYTRRMRYRLFPGVY
ncbi:hypothetical protein [Vibrio hangzhouensis]|uniref:hypothetical protein n=1 Tax=Vibrio hangzhouensis TaxID=462991 RepID=UPI001ABFB6EA|nr:hypothetical protein [Vibrio hangzhouensis]